MVAVLFAALVAAVRRGDGARCSSFNLGYALVPEGVDAPLRAGQRGGGRR
jgi:hypothetical protein